MTKNKAKLKRWVHPRWKRQIRLQYNKGFDNGYDQGYDRGMNEGRVSTFDGAFDQGYNKGFDNGHRAGYVSGIESTEGYLEGYAKGWEMGAYEGGEQWIEKMLPPDTILPEVSLEQVVAAGVQQYQHAWLKLLAAADVAQRIKQALDTGAPFCVVRIGDGELLTLAQEKVLSSQEILEKGHFLPYAGVQLPDLAARDKLLASLLRANVIGIPDKRLITFQPLAFRVFQAYEVPYRTMALTNSLINYQLYEKGFLGALLHGKKIMCIGNLASSLSEIMRRQGFQVEGVIDQVKGMNDAERVIRQADGQYDIALVSAGVAAVVICEQIASRYGKVAIDFGHLADRIIQEQV